MLDSSVSSIGMRIGTENELIDHDNAIRNEMMLGMAGEIDPATPEKIKKRSSFT